MNTLFIRAVIFAVLWTAFMVWWSGNYGIVNILILAVCGAIVAAVWAWAMAWVQRRREARTK